MYFAQLALGQFVCGCIATMSGSTDNPFHPYDSTGTVFDLAPIMGWLGGGALVDIIIAVAMYILLHKSRRGERERHILLNRLIKHIVGSGIVTVGSRGCITSARALYLQLLRACSARGLPNPCTPQIICEHCAYQPQ